MITPTQKAPEFDIKQVDGGIWNLKSQAPTQFTMLTFYRGLHCPVCKSYLEEMQKLRLKYAELGVEFMAVSMDTQDRAVQAKSEWDIADLTIGYELTEAQAKTWGLYLSKGIKAKEPRLFSEPGLFLIRPNNEVYYVALNSQPFGRPHLRSFLKSIEYIVTNNYPSRGEVKY